MSIKTGLVGLPNVGKSTLFNALTKSQVPAQNYPFCTIDPHIAITHVPDQRIDKLQQIYQSEKTIPATVTFVDIAGLVKGAASGEGLGNQFLSHIREVDLILHVLRCFEDADVTHVEGRIDPIADAETIETELMLADLESLERRLEGLEKRRKGGDMTHRQPAPSALLSLRYVSVHSFAPLRLCVRIRLPGRHRFCPARQSAPPQNGRQDACATSSG